jgi:hypothetical protein
MQRAEGLLRLAALDWAAEGVCVAADLLSGLAGQEWAANRRVREARCRWPGNRMRPEGGEAEKGGEPEEGREDSGGSSEGPGQRGVGQRVSDHGSRERRGDSNDGAAKVEAESVSAVWVSLEMYLEDRWGHVTTRMAPAYSGT